MARHLLHGSNSMTSFYGNMKKFLCFRWLLILIFALSHFVDSFVSIVTVLPKATIDVARDGHEMLRGNKGYRNVQRATPHNYDQNNTNHVLQDDINYEDIFGRDFSRRHFVAATISAASGIGLFCDPAAAADTTKTRTKDDMRSSKIGIGREPSYETMVPFSSTRKYKSIKYSNGLRVLLVSDVKAVRASAALTISQAGQFQDPEDLPGLAHLMEHMVLSSNARRSGIRSKYQDFEDWISDYQGASNGYTAYENVCFHFASQPDALSEALERFSGLFLQEVVEKVCREEDTLQREIRRVNSELDFSNEFTQEKYLVKSLFNPNHPYSRFNAGNDQTLRVRPAELGINVGERLIQFYKERYQPSRAILVVVSPADLSSLEFWAAPFASALSRQKEHDITDEKKLFPEAFPQQNRIAPICLYRAKKTLTALNEKIERLSFRWALQLDYGQLGQDEIQTVTAPQIGFILAQILGRRGPGGMYLLLKQRGWIPNGSSGVPRISFPVDVSGFQLMKLEISLTLEGFSNRSAVIAAVYDSINSLKSYPFSKSPFLLSRELIGQYLCVAQLFGSILAPRPSDAIELAQDGQYYGVDGPRGVGNPGWYRMPLAQDYSGVVNLQKCIGDILNHISDPLNAIIIITASQNAIQAAKANIFDDSLPRLSPASWNISPLTGARYFADNSFRLSGGFSDWLVARLMEDEVSAPVLNPLIPPSFRPARLPTEEPVQSSILLEDVPENNGREIVLRPVSFQLPSDNKIGDPTRFSIVRDYWAVLQVIANGQKVPCLPLPIVPPERSCRCAFVLQLISSRPARANVKMAASAELWKTSFEYAVSDLVELGAPAGLAYEISFNKFGMRICFLGLSQNIASYARRLSRRMVEHQTKLLGGPEYLPKHVVDSAVRTANQVVGLSLKRRRQIINRLQESTAYDAALEGFTFFKSCSGGVCISQGDLLPKETIALLADLKVIFRSVIGSNVRPIPATPEVRDIIYRPKWIPRNASPCTINGVKLISDACGRMPR